MRKTLLAALLATTALTAAPAKAGQLALFISGLSAGFGGGVGALSFAGLASPGFAIGTTLGGLFGGTVLGQVLLSVGLNAVFSALTPRPQAPEPSARLANYAQPVSYAEWPVGRTRKGGPLGFTGFAGGVSDTAKRRYYSVVLSAAPIEGVVTHYLDDREALIDGSGIVQTSPMTDLGRINIQTGTGNTVDADLLAKFPEVTSSYDFAGLAVAHLWAKRPAPEKFSEAYPNGREWNYAPLLDGVKVYDPRSDTTAHSRNLALNTAYWLTEILGKSVDWDEVAEEADECDKLVTNGEGGTQPKWQLDGTFNDDEDFEAQRGKVALAGDVWFYERADGNVGFRVGRYQEPSVTLTDADLFQISLSEGFWGRGAPTEIAPIYVEPSQKWREAPAGTIVLDTTTRQVRDEPTLYMVASHNQACRCAKRIAAIKRAKYRLQGTLGFKGYDLIGERFVRVQALGVDQVFEIQELYRNEGGHTFDILGQSVESSDFDFNAALEEPTRPAFTPVTNDNTVAAVAGLSGVAQDGGAIIYTWTQADESLTQELRFRQSGDTAWTTIPLTSSQDTYVLNGLADGVTYEAQIRNVTSARRPSAWTSTLSVAVVANSTAPAALTAFSTSETLGTVTVDFTAPNDGNYYATRIYRADYASGYSGSYDIEDAAVIRTEYGIPSNDDSYQNTGLSAGHYAYWGAPINASGVEGTASGPETEDVV